MIRSKSTRLEDNRRALEMVKSGDFDRSVVAGLYSGLGGLIENQKGLAGLHERRQKDHAQFFTPDWVVVLATEMLAIPRGARVLDNACGAGAFFGNLYPETHAVGIEVEENAHAIASAVYPGACIINDDMINHVEDVEGQFDYFMGNPPFSIMLERDRVPLENAGYGGRILSQVCAVEVAFRAVIEGGYIAMVLPSDLFTREDTRMLTRWIGSNGRRVALIDLPAGTFEGTDWPCSLFVWQKMRCAPFELRYGAQRPEVAAEDKAFTAAVDDPFDIYSILDEWRATPHYMGYSEVKDRSCVETFSTSIKIDPRDPFIIERIEKTDTEEIATGASLGLSDHDVVTVAVGEKTLSVKPNGLHAALKIAEAEAMGLTSVDYRTKQVRSAWATMKQLRTIYTNYSEVEDVPAIQFLSKLGIEVVVDPQLRNWLKRKNRWWDRQNAPFEQWIQRTENADWEEIHVENGVRSQSAEMLKQREILYSRLAIYYPFLDELWDHQKDDVIRGSLKQVTLMAKQQGLGKTRSAMAWGVLTQVSCVLFVVPGHLMGEWEEEADERGLPLHVIEGYDDLRHLGQFNLISYDLLGRPIDGKNKARAEKARELKAKNKRYPRHKTFADVLARKVKAVAFDEAHLMSNKLTIRTQACKKLKPKYKLALTGTPINNTVKNLWGVMDVLYGGGYDSTHGHPAFPYNTKQFVDSFVTVEWVTRQFEETASTGRTAQQRAVIKNVRDFQELMAPKMIRRVQREPMVSRDIVMPTYELIEHAIKPDKQHLAHYKKHLIEFADWFRDQLEQEEQGHTIDTTALLAHIGQLMFASTIPQHRKVNFTGFAWPGGLCAKQEQFVELVKDEISRNNRIFVASIRPDFATMAVKWLQDEGIKAIEFTGNVDRRERIAIKKRIRYDESIKVMVGSYGVAATGLNLWFLQSAILVDYPWKYSEMEQLWFRLLRPQQTGTPRIHVLHNEGMIDAYMKQHCRDKKSASEEGIDRREDVEHIETWTTWKDFTIAMLIAEGLWEQGS